MLNAGLLPTRKWWATQVTALAGLITAWLVAGAWDRPLSITAVTLGAQALVGYLVPNLPTPGGVPVGSDGSGPAADGAPAGLARTGPQ
jgi:hypothetical protein